jgi:uncharacterized protein (DUF433 family)
MESLIQMTTESPRITLDPKVLAGKPVIRGSRLSVEFVIGLMADGWGEAEILANYPGISRDDIIACLAYARDILSSNESSRPQPEMRFLANENFPGAAVQLLQSAGHDILWVRTAAPGTSDPDVLAWAARESRILLTFDKDSGELARVSAYRLDAVSFCFTCRCRKRSRLDSALPISSCT